MSSAYLRLLILLPANLIPACASSSPAFRMLYSAYNLNKQGDNIQPWCTPFPIWNHSVVPCLVLTLASWPAYTQEADQVVWYSHLFMNFPQSVVIHTVKGFGVVNKAAVDVFWNACFFDDPEDDGNLIYDSSAFSKTSLNIWNFTQVSKPTLSINSKPQYFQIFPVNYRNYCFNKKVGNSNFMTPSKLENFSIF